MFIDYRNGVPVGGSAVNVNTGVAIANASTSAASLTFTLRDLAGQTIASGTAALSPGQHIAKFVDQLQGFASGFVLPTDFATTIRFATLEVRSGQAFSAVALRLTVNQRGETLLTSTPVADLTSPTTTSSLVFPQFVDGGGYTNTIILLNTSTAPQSGMIRFRDDSGASAPVAVGGASNAEFAYNIPAGGAAVYETSGAGASATAGYIEVTPDTGTTSPAGAGVFRLVQNGIVVTETGVSASSPSQRMRVFVDTSFGHDTGIAFVNPGSSPVNLTMTPIRKDGVVLVGAESITLGPNSHTAKFAKELVPLWPQGSGGVLEIAASAPVQALTLRSLVNQRGEFLLTTFPVADLDRNAPQVLFPQVVDGGGYRTEIILISPGATPISARVSFFGDAGQGLSLPR
jgi:hypothetical protein